MCKKTKEIYGTNVFHIGEDSWQDGTADHYMNITFEDSSTNDIVKHPNHYCAGGIECIDYLKAKLQFIQDGFIAFCVGGAIKYLSRFPLKGKPLQDLKKAQMFINWAVERQEELEGVQNEEPNGSADNDLQNEG